MDKKYMEKSKWYILFHIKWGYDDSEYTIMMYFIDRGCHMIYIRKDKDNADAGNLLRVIYLRINGIMLQNRYVI